MEDCCAVCAEPLEWVGYGVCGHRDVCSTCIARLRFVLNDKCCCICKQECVSVFMTKALGDYTKVVKKFEGLHECGNFWYENNIQAFFDDKDHYTMVKAMCRLSCQVCERSEGLENSKDVVKKGHVFKSLDLLRQHISIVHNLEMCSLCLEGRKIFICEQKLYSKAQLERHSATGDSTVDGVGEERGGFSGHPMCKFCHKRYYGDNELYHHMSVDHYLCHICQRLHPGHYDYFCNYDDLEAHFRHEHSLCEHPDCLAKKFVVFTSDVELKRHNALTHGGSMSRSQRTAALQIPVSFQYRRPQIHGQGSPSNNMNGHLSQRGHGHNRLNSLELEAGGSPDIHLAHSIDENVSESFGQVGEIPIRNGSGYSTAAGGTSLPSLAESAFPPLPGLKGARRKTKQRTRGGPPIVVDRALGGIDSGGPSISSNQSHMHERIEGSSISRADNSSQNQWQQFLAREKRSEGHVNVIKTARTVNTKNASLVHKDVNKNIVHDNLTVSESPLVNRLDNTKNASLVNKDMVQDNLNVSESPLVNHLNNGFIVTDEVRIANKALSECIRSRLGDDEKLFTAFKGLSTQFRKGIIDANLYCIHVVSLGLWDIVPELARLCPDPERQGSLLNAYMDILEEKQSADLKEDHLQLTKSFNPDFLDEFGNSAKKEEAFDLTSARSTMDTALRLTDRGGTTTGNFTGGASSRDNYKGKQKAESSTSRSMSNVEGLSANGTDSKLAYSLISGSTERDLTSSSTSSPYVTEMWSCNVCTLDNSDLDSECIACGTPRTSCPDAAIQSQGKRTKKISKFERLRLDHDAPPQLPPPQAHGPVQKTRSGGAWKNGGGQRLLALAQREAVIEAAWRRPS